MCSSEPITEAIERFSKIDNSCREQARNIAVQFRKKNRFKESPIDEFFAAKLREFMLYLHYDAITKIQIEKTKPDPTSKQLLKEIVKGCWNDSLEKHPFEYFKGKFSIIGFDPSAHKWSLEASFANILAFRLCKNPDRETILQFLPVAYECRSTVRIFCEENPDFYQ
ncbi:MAG: hypothetical protein VX619_07010 [bacterium]|nr:hypothetical protein [bacterium]